MGREADARYGYGETGRAGKPKKEARGADTREDPMPPIQRMCGAPYSSPNHLRAKHERQRNRGRRIYTTYTAVQWTLVCKGPSISYIMPGAH